MPPLFLKEYFHILNTDLKLQQTTEMCVGGGGVSPPILHHNVVWEQQILPNRKPNTQQILSRLASHTRVNKNTQLLHRRFHHHITGQPVRTLKNNKTKQNKQNQQAGKEEADRERAQAAALWPRTGKQTLAACLGRFCLSRHQLTLQVRPRCAVFEPLLRGSR